MKRKLSAQLQFFEIRSGIHGMDNIRQDESQVQRDYPTEKKCLKAANIKGIDRMNKTSMNPPVRTKLP